MKLLAPNAASLRKMTLPWILCGVFAGSLSLRVGVALTHPESSAYLYYTHLRLDSLAFGFLLAFIYHTRHDFWKRIAQHRRLLDWNRFRSRLHLRDCCSPDGALEFSIGLTLLYLGYGALLIACVSATEPSHPIARAFNSVPGGWVGFVGYYSYSIYLWHVDLDWPLGVALRNGWAFQSNTLTWIAGTAVYVAAAVLVGVAMARLVEFPTLRLRDRIYPRRTRAVNASTG